MLYSKSICHLHCDTWYIKRFLYYCIILALVAAVLPPGLTEDDVVDGNIVTDGVGGR